MLYKHGIHYQVKLVKESGEDVSWPKGTLPAMAAVKGREKEISRRVGSVPTSDCVGPPQAWAPKCEKTQ